MPLDLVRTFGRWATFVAIGLMLLWVGGAALYRVLLPPDVQMPSRSVSERGVDAMLNDDFLGIAGPERLHFVVQFRRELTQAERADLERRLGIALDGPIPENAYMTSATAENWERTREQLLNGSPAAIKIFSFVLADKLSSALRDLTPDTLPDFPISQDKVQVFVSFFADVPDDVQRSVLAEYEASQSDVDDEAIRSDPSGVWAVSVDPASIWELAGEDEVRFIELTTAEIVEDMDQARKDVHIESLNVSGEDTLIAQWEGCQPSTRHPDMQKRITPAGEISALCRAWFYLDLDGSTSYGSNEPIAVDYNEDGVMDDILFDGSAPQLAVLSSGDWIELALRNVDGAGLYTKQLAGNPDQVEVGDVAMTFPWPNYELTPVDVAAGDPHLGKPLHAYLFADHPTLVAGTMISNSNSAQTAGEVMYPGIAPMGKLRSYAWNHLSTTADYPNAAVSGARISSNSFGWSDDYYHVSATDAYGKISRFYDVVSSGRTETGASSTLGARLLVVGSSGNRGTDVEFWSTARIANSAKNVLSVGNVSSAESETSEVGLGLPAADSGRGPTRFGRLTPILSAPGDHFKCDMTLTNPGCAPHADGGIMTTTVPQGYKAVRGTSFSTPIVSATAAVLSQAYQQTCSVEPQPQDLRALLVHSARDLTQAGNLNGLTTSTKLVGPDFVFGFGLVQADEAFGLLRHSVRHEISHGWVEHKVNLNSDAQLVDSAGVKQLRVTLVWDDPAYYNGVPPRAVTGFLQNDLDLEVIGPDGHRYLPWVLDPSNGNEGTAATRKDCTPFHCVRREYRDHANTIEQVVVDVPADQIGATWTVRVRGYKIRRGPQAYTLVSEAFQQLPGTDCGTFSNGFSTEISNPFVLPDTVFWCVLFWVALILLLWLIFEALLLLFDSLWKAGHTFYAWLAVVVLVAILIYLFRLVHTQALLPLAIVTLIGMSYVFWRARRP